MAVSGIPLAMVGDGQMVEVSCVQVHQHLRRRILELGLTPGTRIKVVRGGHRGAVIIDVRGSRLVLGRQMAMKVMVSPVC